MLTHEKRATHVQQRAEDGGERAQGVVDVLALEPTKVGLGRADGKLCAGRRAALRPAAVRAAVAVRHQLGACQVDEPEGARRHLAAQLVARLDRDAQDGVRS